LVAVVAVLYMTASSPAVRGQREAVDVNRERLDGSFVSWCGMGGTGSEAEQVEGRLLPGALVVHQHERLVVGGGVTP